MSWRLRMFMRGDSRTTDEQKRATKKSVTMEDLKRVEVVFVPRAMLGNTYANLSLVGTKCYFQDEKYKELNALRCDRYYPAGSLLATDAEGNIGSIHTWSDIGQLDYAFNDYLNFLMAVRLIYESDDSDAEKVAKIDALENVTGHQGHAYSVFIDKHEGAKRILKKCRGFHPEP